jgi:hypothetical protein
VDGASAEHSLRRHQVPELVDAERQRIGRPDGVVGEVSGCEGAARLALVEKPRCLDGVQGDCLVAGDGVVRAASCSSRTSWCC